MRRVGDRLSEPPFIPLVLIGTHWYSLVQMDTANLGAIAIHSAVEICGTSLSGHPTGCPRDASNAATISPLGLRQSGF